MAQIYLGLELTELMFHHQKTGAASVAAAIMACRPGLQLQSADCYGQVPMTSRHHTGACGLVMEMFQGILREDQSWD